VAAPRVWLDKNRGLCHPLHRTYSSTLTFDISICIAPATTVGHNIMMICPACLCCLCCLPAQVHFGSGKHHREWGVSAENGVGSEAILKWRKVSQC
jgi:hypothetical protein